MLTFWVLLKLFNAQRHPLSRFPGPPTAKFSNFSHCKRFLGGRQPYEMLNLHRKYGPVVRVAPNELSFSTSSSWRDIYDKRKGHMPFIKSDFYDGGNFAAEAHSIVSERDPEKHAQMRRYLRDAFSDRSLREQEAFINQSTDEFITRIGEAGGSSSGIDIVLWFNLVTFDIIGNLAFGQSFGGVSSGTEHFWVSIVVKSLRMGALADCFKRFPWLGVMFQRVFPKLLNKLIEDTRKHEAYTMSLVKKRISQKSNRKDFLTKILHKREIDNVSDIQIAAHSSDFVIAGSETTATALSCITYYLQKHPHVLKRLQHEVQTAFGSYQDIDGVSTSSLPYMNAVILEGMRMYPPLPFPLPRVIPEGGDTVDGYFIPGGTIVSTNPFAASMSSDNFHDPWVFNPERWLDSEPEDNLEASQPFSLGPRSCLGKSLGWLEMRTILAKMHFKYDFELLDPSLDWHAQSEMHTLWQKPVMKVVVKPRCT
ncbi:benzoate 4-monooxygenase cytochrome P450 [Dactylonectria macrodidyma]|uniref:Benzoate 4-monooxygenase cytochrome P450 n=1 Tax=Dactylonectria macrodidyma TaxID=307937 RepID=A0A9P9EP15_9HYPO|nr:benzoate 4-monooxygenase cytochrome P450 [Dactylonectria macrodidyma]